MISQEQFDKAKADSSGKDPLIKKVKLSDIKIDDKRWFFRSVEAAYIGYRGTFKA